MFDETKNTPIKNMSAGICTSLHKLQHHLLVHLGEVRMKHFSGTVHLLKDYIGGELVNF